MTLERQHYLKTEGWQSISDQELDINTGEPAPPETANLVSSIVGDGQHAPALDIDVPARLVPSSTEGHSHLFIDVTMTWPQYERLLNVLADVGIIEKGFHDFSIQRGGTFLRTRPKGQELEHLN